MSSRHNRVRVIYRRSRNGALRSLTPPLHCSLASCLLACVLAPRRPLVPMQLFERFQYSRSSHVEEFWLCADRSHAVRRHRTCLVLSCLVLSCLVLKPQGDGGIPQGNRLASMKGNTNRTRPSCLQIVILQSGFWPTVVSLILLSLLAAVLELAHPLFLRHILDHVLLSDDLTESQQVRQLNLA